jgi:mono/diheme cytochrome c family protein
VGFAASGRAEAGGIDSAAVRRLVTIAALALVAAGCGGKTVAPLPSTVVGTVAKEAAAPKGNAAAGKPVFASAGCGGCHTFTPAGTKASVGPDLDKLAQYAKQANQGSLDDFTRESIVNPGAYVQPGFQNIMPTTFGQSLKPQQISDLVAFLTQKS